MRVASGSFRATADEMTRVIDAFADYETFEKAFQGEEVPSAQGKVAAATQGEDADIDTSDVKDPIQEVKDKFSSGAAIKAIDCLNDLYSGDHDDIMDEIARASVLSEKFSGWAMGTNSKDCET